MAKSAYDNFGGPMSKKGRVAQILMTPVDRVARRVSGFYRAHKPKWKGRGWKPGTRELCQCCGKVFPNESALQMHLHQEHPAVYGWPDDELRPTKVRCRLCHEVIENKNHARHEHMVTHPMEQVLKLDSPGLYEAWTSDGPNKSG